jgi:hypothetical protein
MIELWIGAFLLGAAGVFLLRRMRKPPQRPILSILNIKRDVSDQNQKRFDSVDRAALNEGYYAAMDFRMEDLGGVSFGRFYIHGETMTVMSARLPESKFGLKPTVEFYSTFTDQTLLFTTNAPHWLNFNFPASVRAQRVSGWTSLAKASARHKKRLINLAEGERKIVFDKHQRFFSLIERVFTGEPGSSSDK